MHIQKPHVHPSSELALQLLHVSLISTKNEPLTEIKMEVTLNLYKFKVSRGFPIFEPCPFISGVNAKAVPKLVRTLTNQSVVLYSVKTSQSCSLRMLTFKRLERHSSQTTGY